ILNQPSCTSGIRERGGFINQDHSAPKGEVLIAHVHGISLPLISSSIAILDRLERCDRAGAAVQQVGTIELSRFDKGRDLIAKSLEVALQAGTRSIIQTFVGGRHDLRLHLIEDVRNALSAGQSHIDRALRPVQRVRNSAETTKVATKLLSDSEGRAIVLRTSNLQAGVDAALDSFQTALGL